MKKDKTALAAVVMAGGEGSRLRPLTCDLPKPMARLCGRPVIEYILALLEENGVGAAAVSVRYLADALISHFPEKRLGGVKLLFAEEDRPLGTAGSVKNCFRALARSGGCDLSDIIIVSGDALCDFDLKKAFEFHKSSGAPATIVAKRVDDPREYGLIKARGGFVETFIEKPSYSQAVSDLANTGIYIVSRGCIDMIPEDEKYDFAKDLFPAMLGAGKKLAVFEEKGYWCDIGDLKSYLACQEDILRGRVELARPFIRDASGSIAESGLPEGRFTLIPPVYIGRGVSIGDGAVIDSGSVLDDGVIVGEEAHINGSVLLENSTVGDMASVSHGIICAGAVCKSRSMVFEEAAVGSRSILGSGARVDPGIRIWPRKSIPEHSVVSSHLRFSGSARLRFGEDGIEGETGTELTSELCARIGCALGAALGSSGGHVAVGCSGTAPAVAFRHAAASGALSAGLDVYDLGDCSRDVFSYGMTLGGLRLGVWIEGVEECRVHVVQEGGLPAVRAVERSVENALGTGELPSDEKRRFGRLTQISDSEVLYESHLRGMLSGSEKLRELKIDVASDGVSRGRALLLERLLRETGVKSGRGLTVRIGETGVSLSDAQGAFLSEQRVFGLCCMAELEKGPVAVGCGAPRILDGIAARHGTRLLRYMSCPADDSDSEARRVAALQLWSRDTVMQAIKVLRHIADNGLSVRRFAELLPDFAVTGRTVRVERDPAGIVGRIGNEDNALNASDGGIGEGAVFRTARGYATLRTLKKGDGIRITAEADSAETAEEICGFYAKRVEQLRNSLDTERQK